MPELDQEKIFKYLTAVLGLVVFVLLVREIFFTPAKLTLPEITFPIIDVNVRTEVFDEFNVGELTNFQAVTLPEIIGRERPFEPYSIAEYQDRLQRYYGSSTIEVDIITATSSAVVAENEGLKTYSNSEYEFTMTYPGDWNGYVGTLASDTFIKGNLRYDDLIEGKFNNNDCFVTFMAIYNGNRLELDNFFEKFTVSEHYTVENVKLGENDFVKWAGGFYENGVERKDFTYSIIHTNSGGKEVLSFGVTNSSKNEGCRNEVESILSTLKMN